MTSIDKIIGQNAASEMDGAQNAVESIEDRVLRKRRNNKKHEEIIGSLIHPFSSLQKAKLPVPSLAGERKSVPAQVKGTAEKSSDNSIREADRVEGKEGRKLETTFLAARQAAHPDRQPHMRSDTWSDKAVTGDPPERTSGQPESRDRKNITSGELKHKVSREVDETAAAASVMAPATANQPVTGAVKAPLARKTPGNDVQHKTGQETSVPGNEKLTYQFTSWGKNHSVVVQERSDGITLLRPSDEFVGTRLGTALSGNDNNGRWRLDQDSEGEHRRQQHDDSDEDKDA